MEICFYQHRRSVSSSPVSNHRQGHVLSVLSSKPANGECLSTGKRPKIWGSIDGLLSNKVSRNVHRRYERRQH
jgi:hypothetical protein